jgi:hypothetical protein
VVAKRQRHSMVSIVRLIILLDATLVRTTSESWICLRNGDDFAPIGTVRVARDAGTLGRDTFLPGLSIILAGSITRNEMWGT